MKWRYVQLVVLVLLAIQSLLSVNTVRKSNNAINANRKTLAFLCETSGGLSTVLSDAADQIQENFDNGTYARLLAKGISTKESVEKAAATRNSYRTQAKKLRNPNSPCKTSRKTAE